MAEPVAFHIRLEADPMTGKPYEAEQQDREEEGGEAEEDLEQDPMSKKSKK